MNRKERRAAQKGDRLTAERSGQSAVEQINRLFYEAAQLEMSRKFDDAARIYKRVLALKPDHAQAWNNLGRAMQELGKTQEASASFAKALQLMPQLLEQYAGISATLVALLPPLANALRLQTSAWPKRLSEDELFGDTGLAAIESDPLLLFLLQSTPVRDVAFERLLAALRLSFLEKAASGKSLSGRTTTFACALARQCFINEYIFPTTVEEDSQIEKLKRTLAKPASTIEPAQLIVLAMYAPLHALSLDSELLAHPSAPPIDALLTQQVREPMRERELRGTIPRLTTIEDAISRRVREQYEENPYPRWVHAAGQVQPIAIDQYLRDQFPGRGFATLGKTDDLHVLVAGCGTGQIAIASAQRYLGAKVLGIDLSLASLCYAKRSTPSDLPQRIEYAQADILKLASIDRRFDLIDASGVLHHMADPLEGWRILLGLLQPGGFMHLGFYSETGRADVVAARAFIAERGYKSTPADIRRCRQDILATQLGSVTRFTDFFSTSECRDLLFHVQESRLTIAAIKTFIAQNNLRFLGFEFADAKLAHYRQQFAQQGWTLADLDRWQTIEATYPDTFSGMYQFWVQKG